jgi:hypothetical protein
MTDTKGVTMTAEDEGPDGMVALGLAVQAGQWPHTMDAMVWADEFCKRFPPVSREDALGWFANAIMAGYDTAQMRLSADNARLTAELAEARREMEKCSQYLKEGETPAECIKRNREDTNSTLRMLADERRKVERLEKKDEPK